MTQLNDIMRIKEIFTEKLESKKQKDGLNLLTSMR